MSQYDDADNCSSTQVIGGQWVPFEPCNALTVIGPIFRENKATFF